MMSIIDYFILLLIICIIKYVAIAAFTLLFYAIQAIYFLIAAPIKAICAIVKYFNGLGAQARSKKEAKTEDTRESQDSHNSRASSNSSYSSDSNSNYKETRSSGNDDRASEENTARYIRHKDPYSVMGISHSSTLDEVKRAYRKMAMKFHPDRLANAGKADRKAAEEKMKEINLAYITLQKDFSNIFA